MAEPAHDHAEHPVAPVPATAAGPGYTWMGLAGRIMLTLAGAAGLIIGAFLDWTRGIAGIDLNDRAFVQTTFSASGAFWATVGFASIVLGLLAIVGLAGRSGWLTRLAGALGIAGFVLLVIELYRANMNIGDVQAGAWIALAGSLVALIGGFLGTRTAVVAAAPATAP
jgi:hypothetical protein